MHRQQATSPDIQIIKPLTAERAGRGEKKEQNTGDSLESSSPNIVKIILYMHKEDLCQGKDASLSKKDGGEHEIKPICCLQTSYFKYKDIEKVKINVASLHQRKADIQN